MEIGKVPENVLKRSILNQIKTTRSEVLVGASVGEDCAVLQLEPDEVFVMSTDPITGTTKDIGKWAVIISANDIASSGAEVVGVMVCALLPPKVREIRIREIMEEIQGVCDDLHIQVIGGHTEITDAVNRPVLSITGVGKVKKDKMIQTGGAKPGDDVVITKWVGLEGTSIIAKEKEEELLTYFPPHLVNEAKGFDVYLPVLSEAAIAAKSGVSAMHDITEGGVFGALWEMAESAGIGLTVDLKQIPIKQATVEISNYYDINPYKLISSGSMLIASSKGHDLVRELKAAGIEASVVGKFTDSNDKIVVSGEETRYLEPPKTDELYSVLK